MQRIKSHRVVTFNNFADRRGAIVFLVALLLGNIFRSTSSLTTSILIPSTVTFSMSNCDHGSQFTLRKNSSLLKKKVLKHTFIYEQDTEESNGFIDMITLIKPNDSIILKLTFSLLKDDASKYTVKSFINTKQHSRTCFILPSGPFDHLQSPHKVNHLLSNSGKTSSTILFMGSKFKNFEEVLDVYYDVPILVTFSSRMCGPCKLMKEQLEIVRDIMQDNVVLFSIDTDRFPALGSRYNVKTLPTTLLFKQGNPVYRFSGIKPANELIQQLQLFLNS